GSGGRPPVLVVPGLPWVRAGHALTPDGVCSCRDRSGIGEAPDAVLDRVAVPELGAASIASASSTTIQAGVPSSLSVPLLAMIRCSANWLVPVITDCLLRPSSFHARPAADRA